MALPARTKGFTIIELLVVVTIIGVLAAIAFPQYTRYLQQSRRVDGHSALLRLAGQLEKYYTQCGQYTTNINAGNISTCTGLATALSSTDGHYTLSIVLAPSASGLPNQLYTATATPVATSSQAKDMDCLNLTLTNAGVRGRSGSAPVDRCWRQ